MRCDRLWFFFMQPGYPAEIEAIPHIQEPPEIPLAVAIGDASGAGSWQRDLSRYSGRSIFWADVAASFCTIAAEADDTDGRVLQIFRNHAISSTDRT